MEKTLQIAKEWTMPLIKFILTMFIIGWIIYIAPELIGYTICGLIIFGLIFSFNE